MLMLPLGEPFLGQLLEQLSLPSLLIVSLTLP